MGPKFDRIMVVGLQKLPRKSVWSSYQRVLYRCCYDARDFTSSVR